MIGDLLIFRLIWSGKANPDKKKAALNIRAASLH
jgi:hypothetical protein